MTDHDREYWAAEQAKYDAKFDRSYHLACAALKDVEGVTVKHLNHIRGGPIPHDPMALMASFPPAYSVDVIALETGINVMRNSRFGFSVGGPNVIPFPTDPDAEDAAERLAEVLVPYVQEQLRLAEEDRESVTDDGPIESRDAVRRIG